MKRYLALAATVIALLVTACAGTASAAATGKPPTPQCDYEARPYDPPCTCPPGWHVVYPDWWDYILDEPACARND